MAFGLLLIVAAAVWVATMRSRRKPPRPWYDVPKPKRQWPKG